jgi:dienelactone hydrolase
MQRIEVAGRGFHHSIYANTAARLSGDAPESPLWIFIEGDGSPVAIDAMNNRPQPNPDPTARRPIGLELAIQTQAPAIYISRACYGEHRKDSECADRYWTTERYSRPVVASLTAAIEHYARSRPVTLVGYSGGGVIAVLIANRLPTVRAVVTIAANLDIDAWTKDASCLPSYIKDGAVSAATTGCAAFANSVNPAETKASQDWQEFALVGSKDVVVPAHTTARYFDRHPDTVVWKYEAFDHVCCWVETWPEIINKLEEKVRKPTR